MGILQSKHSREISELQKHTNFSRQELHQWYQHFAAASSNGLLDKNNFSRLYIQSFPGGDPRELAKRVFDVFDKDNSGYIDFKEFICALSTTTRGTLDEKLEWMFRLYDIDNDGVITYQEMLSIVKASSRVYRHASNPHENGPTPEERVDMVFRRMKKDKNSTIGFKEFVQCNKEDPTVMGALALSDSPV